MRVTADSATGFCASGFLIPFFFRIPDRETTISEVAAWQDRRNVSANPFTWWSRTEDARIKLKSLYPSIQ